MSVLDGGASGPWTLCGECDRGILWDASPFCACAPGPEGQHHPYCGAQPCPNGCFERLHRDVPALRDAQDGQS